MDSERPKNLNELELEQYNLVIEEQAFPFEEKSIKVHEKNMELLDRGIYNEWIENSLKKLAGLMPARYSKPEAASEFVEFLLPGDEVPVGDKKIFGDINRNVSSRQVALYE